MAWILNWRSKVQVPNVHVRPIDRTINQVANCKSNEIFRGRLVLFLSFRNMFLFLRNIFFF